MNLCLRRVKMDTSQTMFITSTGTVLFTSHIMRDRLGSRSTTVITSIDDQGDVVQVGFIKWNENTGDPPYLCVGACLMEVRATGRDDSLTLFRQSDGQIYRWKRANDVMLLSTGDATVAPIAIVYDNPQSSPTIDDPAAPSAVFCIQPTGFHFLREVVATFVCFEQLSGPIRADYGRKARLTQSPSQGNRLLPAERGIQPTKDGHLTRTRYIASARIHDNQDSLGCHVSRLRTPDGRTVRSTADLTGELLRRYKYPSAYGGFGDIWKCDWIKDSRVIEVAVKVMRTNLTGGQKESECKRISRELKVWVRLEHECVLPLYGISYDFGKFPAMVCPWLGGGTLSKYLEHHDVLPLNTRLNLLSDIADGLHYLHGCGIVHGDLTGSNVLIKDNGRACLSDFGLSRIFMEVTGSSFLTSTVRGSIRWAAPELFAIGDEQYPNEPVHVLPSPQSDVYSFGSTMLQVLTGKVPYDNYKNDAQVLVALSRGLRPARPDNPPIEDVHWEFMQQCWTSLSARPRKHDRPSIDAVVDFLAVARTHASRAT